MSALPLCFVISPIGQRDTDIRRRADMLLRYIIVPALRSKYNIRRADQDTRSGSISHQLIRDIKDAALVISDLSAHNANVYYELGVAHTMGKKVIHLFDENGNLPFDTKDIRYIGYDPFEPDSHDIAIRKIQEYEATLLDDKSGIFNPVTVSLNSDVPVIDQNLVAKATLEQLISDVEKLKAGQSTRPQELRIDDAGVPVAVAAGKLLRNFSGDPYFVKLEIERKDGIDRLVLRVKQGFNLSAAPKTIDGYDVSLDVR